MNALSSRNRIQLGSITARQPYFVKNIISNESVICSNAMTQRTNKNLNSARFNNQTNSDSSSKKRSASRNEHINTNPIRRSYGTTVFNYQNKVQLNNRCSVQDNMISSDVLLKIDHKRQEFLKEKQSKRLSQLQKLKKQPVNIKEYRDYLKTEQIADAYYFVNQQVQQARQREKKKKDTIQKVKSLSRSNSNEQGIQFRRKQQDKLNCIQQLEHMKQKYSKLIVPELMGMRNLQLQFSQTASQQNTMRKVGSATDLKISRSSKLNNQPSKKQSQISKPKNNPSNQKQSQQQKRPMQQSSCLSSSKINSKSKVQQVIPTKVSLKQKSSINSNSSSMLKVLNKCKSTQQFMMKERVKTIKEAFSHNWKQGQNKLPDKSNDIYPCKYTRQLQTEKKKIKQTEQIQKAQSMYGPNALRKSPISTDFLQETQAQTMAKRHDALKQYQLKFQQIAKKNIKSCVIVKS